MAQKLFPHLFSLRCQFLSLNENRSRSRKTITSVTYSPPSSFLFAGELHRLRDFGFTLVFYNFSDARFWMSNANNLDRKDRQFNSFILMFLASTLCWIALDYLRKQKFSIVLILYAQVSLKEKTFVFSVNAKNW